MLHEPFQFMGKITPFEPYSVLRGQVSWQITGETMSQYYVEVYTYHPYKIGASYVEKASNYGVAINRALAKFRRTEKLKRRKIKQVWATARIS